MVQLGHELKNGNEPKKNVAPSPLAQQQVGTNAAKLAHRQPTQQHNVAVWNAVNVAVRPRRLVVPFRVPLVPHGRVLQQRQLAQPVKKV